MANDTAPAQWDGRPENPDVDGWHWLKDDVREHPTPVVWNAELGGWVSGPLYSPQAVLDLGFQYLGPCLTPSEHHQRTQAASAAAWLAARDACAATIDKSLTVYEMCRFIRALPPPADVMAALAEAVRREVEREREACISIINETEFPPDGCELEHAACAEFAEAIESSIRARSTEGGA